MATFFPHLTSTGSAPDSREVRETYRQAFAIRVEEGSLRPLVLPYHFYSFFVLIIYLCIPHKNRPSLYAARWIILAGIFVFQWKTLWETTSMNMSVGFVAGVISAWGVFASLTWLVLCRPQWDAKRVQRRMKPGKVSGTAEEAFEQEPCTNGVLKGKENGNFGSKSNQENVSGVPVLSSESEFRQRTQTTRGTDEMEASKHIRPNGSSHGRGSDTLKQYGTDDSVEYYWQSYPDDLTERIPWVWDLIVNFRGPGWNWAIPPLPPLPPSIKLQLGEPVDSFSKSGVSAVGMKRFDTRQELLRSQMPRFVVGYFLLDIIKVVMMKDPYFYLGPNTYELPSHLQSFSPWSIYLLRGTISACVIIVSLEMMFLIMPLTVCLLFGPKTFGLRAEPWYYPTTWGAWSNIMNKGLGGLWGCWWHQTFRFVFSAPSNYLIDNGYMNARTTAAKISALLFAFGISGILHTAGSISQFAKTRPWDSMTFFMLQTLGVTIQVIACLVLRPITKQFPKNVRQAGNLLYTLVWMYSTGSWLADDFARGGVYLYEPIPISPFRGLGFGDKGDGWWCWEHIGVGWYTGKHWWESGVAI